MRLVVMVVSGLVLLGGCGHGSYDDFVNNSTSTAWGVTSCVLAVAFGGLFVLVNRTRDSKWADMVLSGVFILSLGAGLAWLNDPEGWLTMTRPTIDSIGTR